MLTRRRLLGGAGAVTAAAIIGRDVARAETPPFETVLPIPELRDARAQNGAIQLVAAEGRHAFLPGRPTTTYGFSAPYLGPVLRVHSGDEVQVTVENRLDRDTTAHWHGVLVPAAVDGGPHVVIKPGSTWHPVLKINQPEATTWYHPHPHLDTGRQVYMGLTGLIIIEDGTAEKLGLPRSYGVDDLPIILQDRQFDRSGALVYNTSGPSRMMGMRGDTLIVNGVLAPVARGAAGPRSPTPSQRRQRPKFRFAICRWTDLPLSRVRWRLSRRASRDDSAHDCAERAVRSAGRFLGWRGRRS